MDPAGANVVAVHDLLSDALAQANAEGDRFGYGLALFPRTGRFEALVFGVVTRGGESTTLTHRMLDALLDLPIWVSGRVAATIRGAQSFVLPAATPTGLKDQPVLHLVFTCHLGPDPEDHDRTMPFESTVFAGEMRAPIILLTQSRPEGWPL